jgi:hypothetical protein
MLDDNGMPRRGDAVSPAPGTPDQAPSSVARARLSEALRERTQTYQHEASVDLTMLGALLRLDRPEAAVKSLEEQRASLHALARDLQVAVAEAAVEREAELVCAAAEQMRAQSGPVNARGFRGRVMAMVGAAAVVVALVLPTARFAPRTTLVNVEGSASAYADLAASRGRLEAARSVARALRSDTASVEDSEAEAATPRQTSDPVVRKTLRPILAADDSGGSAASTLTEAAEVIDLAAYRSRRTAPEPAAVQPAASTDDPGGNEDPPPPPAPPVPEAKPDVPATRMPQGLSPAAAAGAAAVDALDLPEVPEEPTS